MFITATSAGLIYETIEKPLQCLLLKKYDRVARVRNLTNAEQS
jgi:hypothetical protein